MKLLLEQWLVERKQQPRFVANLELWLRGRDAIRSRDPEQVRKHLKIVVNNEVK